MKYKYIMLAIFICFLDIVSVKALDNNVTTFDLDKTQLQEYVKATAYQYYYKNNYTDYEQGTLDNANNTVKTNSFMFRNFSITPEELNESNSVNFDCASFIANVYMNSLGYYFADYYKFSPTYYFYYNSNNYYHRTNSSINYYTYGLLYTGRGFNIDMINNIINNKQTYSKGKIYEYDNNNLLTFHYLATGNETEEEIEAFYEKFDTKLQDGDIISITRIKSGKTLRHALLYFSDIDDQYTYRAREGFLHSTGVDYSFSDPTKGDDTRSITIIEMPYFKKSTKYEKGYFFTDTSSGYSPYSISIIRPINEVLQSKYTNVYNRKYGSNVTSKNTISRSELKNLKIENNAYYYNGENYKELSSYNSLNIGETVKYSLKLTNISSTSNYVVSVSDIIPKNTEYIKCDNCNYDSKTNKVTWTNLEINSNSEYILEYYVKVGNTTNIKNNGFKIITYNNNVLSMPKLSYSVYPTFREEEQTKLIASINEIKNSGANLSKTSILQNIYKSVEINLGRVDYYKNSTFTTTVNGYVRKSNSYSDSYYVNAMVVPGLYGGLDVRGNLDKIRTRNIELKYLEIGDLIIFGNIENSYIYLGKIKGEHTLVDTNYNYYTGDDAVNKLRTIYTYSNFIILRPSKGRLVNAKFDYNGKYENKIIKLSSGNKFSLEYPSVTNTINYDYEENSNINFKDSDSIVNKLISWSYNENIVTNNSIVPYQNNITLKATYENNSLILPFPNIEDKAFDGWYNENGDKVGNANENYIPNKSQTLYAKWHQNNKASISLVSIPVCNFTFEETTVEANTLAKFNVSCDGYYRFTGFENKDIKITKEGTNGYTFVMPNKDIKLVPTYTIDLPKVSNFKAVPVTYNKIKISWNKLNSADGYEIYKCNSTNCKLLTTTQNNTYYTTYGVLTGYRSYYKVRAYKFINDKKVVGILSNMTSAKTSLSQPTNLKLSKIGSRSLKISWNKVSGAHGYYIYRSVNKNSGYKKIATTTKNYYVNRYLKKKQTYYYKVKAYRNVNGKKVVSNYSITKYKRIF